MSALRLLLLAAALLLGQLGGTLHGLSHHGPDKGQPHGACQLCAAYSSLDHGATAAAPAVLTGQIFPAPAASVRTTLRLTCAPPYLSRAPPVHLV